MTNAHQPTPEFERFLEWQVTSAVRRQSRFAEPPRHAYMKHFSVAALAIVSMLVGAGGVTAAGRIQASAETRALLAQQAGDVLLAQMQVDVAKKSAALAQSQAEVGMAPQTAAADAMLNLRQAELLLKRASLGAEEIGASGRLVQDDLAAPLVGKRDFVTERLQLDQEAAGLVARAATDKLKLSKTRFDVGVADQVELTAVQSEMTRAMIGVRTIARLIELRGQFVAGSIKAADVKNQRLIATANSELAIAEADLDAAKTRYAQLEKKSAVGAIGEVDLLKAKVEMLTKQQDIVQIRARIKTLEGK